MMKDLLPELKEIAPDANSGTELINNDPEATHNQIEKVSEEVDVLLGQVQSMHQGFINMKNAGLRPRSYPKYNLSVSTSQPSLHKEPLSGFSSGSSLTTSHTTMVF